MDRTPLDQRGGITITRQVWGGRRWTSGGDIAMTIDWLGVDNAGPAGEHYDYERLAWRGRRWTSGGNYDVERLAWEGRRWTSGGTLRLRETGMERTPFDQRGRDIAMTIDWLGVDDAGSAGEHYDYERLAWR